MIIDPVIIFIDPVIIFIIAIFRCGPLRVTINSYTSQATIILNLIMIQLHPMYYFQVTL